MERMTRDFPIVEMLGGRKAVMKILQKRGVDCGHADNVRMWAQRDPKRIPTTAMIALMKHCRDFGIDYEIEDFEWPTRITSTRMLEAAHPSA